MKTEITLTSTLVLGLILKLAHLPGGSLLVVISLGTLSILYFPFAFYFYCDKNIKTQNLPLSIVSGLLLSTVPLALLFKLQYWPGATIYSYLAIFASIVSLILLFVLKNNSLDNLKQYYKNMLIRVSTLTALSLLFFFLSTKTLVYIQYGQDPELARLKYLHYTNPDNQQYADELEAYQLKKDVEPINDKNTSQ